MHRTIKHLLTFLIMATAGGCGFLAGALPSSLPDDVAEALAGADSIVAYSLHPEKGRGAVRFRDYEVLGQTTITDPATISKIADALAEGADAGDGNVYKCFDPRHGLTIAGPSGTAELLICFECMRGRALIHGQQPREYSTTRSPQATLDQILQNAGVPLGDRPAPR